MEKTFILFNVNLKNHILNVQKDLFLHLNFKDTKNENNNL